MSTLKHDEIRKSKKRPKFKLVIGYVFELVSVVDENCTEEEFKISQYLQGRKQIKY